MTTLHWPLCIITVTLCYLFIQVQPVQSQSEPSHKVVASCPPEAKVCNFEFTIAYNMTMMKWWLAPDTGEPDIMVPVLVGQNGTLYAKSRDCNGESVLSEDEYKTFLSGDGSYKSMLLVNGRLPGTPIVVYKDQIVSVKVRNEMDNDVVTIHWHGLDMRGTPWMDGAGTVSHCPITPRQTFEYRFKADQLGTHWYHSHITHQRTMGLAGHLTVLDRDPLEEKKRRGPDVLPKFNAEYHMMVSEWSRKDTEVFAQSMSSGFMFAFGFDQQEGECGTPAHLIDGSLAHWAEYDSIIINGKTHRYNKLTGESETPTLPLETFNVQDGGYFRFRVINAGLQLSLAISIDNHILHVIATDGGDVKTMKPFYIGPMLANGGLILGTGGLLNCANWVTSVRWVDELVIHSGESFDFWIEASDPTSAGNYWIRATTLEYVPDGVPGQGRAVLHYVDAPEEHPTTQARNCTREVCKVLNCPYGDHPNANIECIPITALRSTIPTPTLSPTDSAGYTEFIMSLDSGLRGAINGRVHYPHSVPPQIYQQAVDPNVLCSDTLCIDGELPLCDCTHEIHIKKDHIVQITFHSNKETNGRGGSSHPTHIHGTKFQVVKIGWPKYHSSNVTSVHNSSDIFCDNRGEICWNPQWTDQSWCDCNIPDVISEGAVIKDTVIIPAGGYVVVRFKADNPGYWLAHCHMDLHSQSGMMLVLKVGEESDMPKTPHGLPVCGNFHWTKEEFHESTMQIQPQSTQRADDLEEPAEDATLCSKSDSSHKYRMLLLTLSVCVCLTSLIVISLGCKTYSSKASKYGILSATGPENLHGGGTTEETPLLT